MPDDELPEVSGFVVTGRAQRADSPDYLTAVDVASRDRVLLRLLGSMDDEERAAVADSLQPFAAVSEENLDRPVSLAAEDDVLVVPTRAWRLDTLPAPPAAPGQVVTVVVPVAQALAALHSAGLAHGTVRAEVVTVDDEGRPRLSETGMAAALHALAPRETSAPSASADRRDLLSLLSEQAAALGDTSFSALVADLVDGDADPWTVADRLLSEVEPVALGDPAPLDEPSSSPPTPTRARWPWLLLALVLVAVAVGVAAIVSTSDDESTPSALPAPTTDPTPTRASAAPMPAATGDPSGSPAPGTPAPSPGPAPEGTQLCGPPGSAPESTPPLADDWAEVVRALYVRRTAALLTGQTSLLCEVYDPRSPGLASDLELDAAYDEQGVRPDALVFVVEEATLVSEDGALLTVEVTDRLEPYRLVDDSGRTIAELPGVESETWQARLVPDSTGSEWVFG